MSEFTSNIQLRGDVEIKIWDEVTGEIKEQIKIPNKILTNGADFAINRMLGTTYGVMSYMAVGTGTTPANIADLSVTSTGLTGGNTATISSSTQGTYGGTPAINQVVYQSTFGAGVATGPITEAAILNANASAGAQTGTTRMLARTVFSAVNKSATDAMAITWTITFVVS